MGVFLQDPGSRRDAEKRLLSAGNRSWKNERAPSNDFCDSALVLLVKGTSLGMGDALGVGSVRAWVFAPSVPKTQVPLGSASVSQLLDLGQVVCFKRLQGNFEEERRFPPYDLSEKCAYTHAFVSAARLALLGHSLANCHLVTTFRAIKMGPKARIGAQTPTKVTRCKWSEVFCDQRRTETKGRLPIAFVHRSEKSRCGP